MFPISEKKCKIFSGIFALNFCEFWHIFSCQKLAFLFPTKNCRPLLFMVPHCCMSHEERRKLAELGRKTFFLFFWRSTSNRRKRCLYQRNDLFFEITLKLDKKIRKFFSTYRGRLKSCGIFTLSLEHLHYFRHFCRR